MLIKSLIEVAKYVSPLAVIVGLVQVAKQVGFPTRYAGLLAVVVGAAVGVLGYFSDIYPQVGTFTTFLMAGLAFGLMAAGLWSTGKNALRG